MIAQPACASSSWRMQMSSLSTLIIKDESIYGSFGGQYVFKLSLKTDRLTVRELIRTRVEREVAEYNERQSDKLYGLLQTRETEQAYSNVRPRKFQPLDGQEQFEKAVQAFQRNGFIILVDQQQVESLDAWIEVKPETEVTFLKLAPLVGG
jgi:hypothetical protein